MHGLFYFTDGWLSHTVYEQRNRGYREEGYVTKLA